MIKPGEWLQWRRDSQRTGHVPLKGGISQPHIAGRLFLGGYEDWLVLKRRQTYRSAVELGITATDGFDEEKVRREWGMDRWIDIEGNGEYEKVTGSSREKYLKLNWGKPGYKRLLFQTCFESENWGVSNDTYGWLEERERGEWKRVWTTPRDEELFWRPNIILCDIDGDGTDEIVVSEKGRIMAYNQFTGEKVRELVYYKARNYGEFYACDFTGNGFPDFVQIAGFPAHVEVILNDGKEFRLAWFEEIQVSISDTDHNIITPYNPVNDIDGDGRTEIIYSRYNQKGDDRWYTLIVEPLNGKVKYEIPDFAAVEILPDSGSGQPLLYGIRCDGNFIRMDGEAAIFEISRKNASRVWTDENVAWCCHTVPEPVTNLHVKVKIASPDGGKTILCREKLSSEKSLYRLTFCRFGNGERIVEGETVVPDVFVQAVDDRTGDILLKTVRTGIFKVEGVNTDMKLICTRNVNSQSNSPVVFCENGKNPLVVTTDIVNRNICCIRYDSEGNADIAWTKPGFGMWGSGVCARQADDNTRRIVYGSSNGKDQARVVEADSCGKITGAIDIARIPSPTLQPISGYIGGGPSSWHTLPLMEADREDIVVTAGKNNMHSYFTCAYDGDRKEMIWRRDKGTRVAEELFGFGGHKLFAGFPKGDGTEDLVSEWPISLIYADGRTGECITHFNCHFGSFYIHDKENDVMKSGPCLYGDPVVIRKNRNIRPNLHMTGYFDSTDYLVLWGGNTFTTAIWVKSVELGGIPWFTPFVYTFTNTPVQGICDINDDGSLELIGWENSKKKVTCRDLVSGDLLWTMEIPGANAGRYYVTCDINGDGKEECLICTGDKLVAVGDSDGKGAEIWSMNLPAACTNPVVADVDGDGFSEILLYCNDGYLYLVKA